MNAIAIIEDSKSIAALYRTYLKESGYALKFFTSFPEDTDRLKTQRDIAVVICPGFPKHQDGPAIVNVLKPVEDFRDTTFIVSTTMTTSQLESDWDLSDIDGILIKPFTKEKLLETVRKAESKRNTTVREVSLAVVVDDSKASVNVLSKKLEKLNFTVESASNGREGLQLIKESMPDVVITDVEMPEMDGFELCRHLSDDWQTNRIPVIVTSAAINYEQFKKGFGAGATHFIKKPISFAQLYAAINSLTTVKDLGPVTNVLVMSPHQTTLSIVLKELSAINMSLNLCGTYEELLAYMGVTRPDIIVADLTDLPGDKLEKTRKIKEHTRESSCILIVLADNTDLNTIMNCLRFGANDFLTTPFLKDELRLRIENHIRMKNLQDELMQKTKMLEILAYKDSLTGLMNRRFFDINLGRELRIAARNNKCVSLIIIDLDDFKEVNDNFGHETGDMVLMDVADIIYSRTQKEGISCRYGGEEFSVIFPGADLNKAHKIAEELRSVCEKKRMTCQKIVQTLSIGVAAYPATSSEDRLVADADKCLYLAKQQGKNRVVAMKNGCPA